jgi:hypothetical protein
MMQNLWRRRQRMMQITRRDELIASANKLLPLFRKMHEDSCRLNPYRYIELYEETVDDPEPLAQTTEDEAINISTSPVKHTRSPRKCQNPMQAASRMTRSISPPPVPESYSWGDVRDASLNFGWEATINLCYVLM